MFTNYRIHAGTALLLTNVRRFVVVYLFFRGHAWACLVLLAPVQMRRIEVGT